MQEEHLRQCILEAIHLKDPDATQWMKVVAIVQEAF